MEANDVFNLLGELGEEYPGVLISLSQLNEPKSKYYENRLNNVESVRPVTEAEKKAYSDRALYYKNEIKEIFRKNIEKNKINNPNASEIALGNLRPNPVFTPWVD